MLNVINNNLLGLI